MRTHIRIFDSLQLEGAYVGDLLYPERYTKSAGKPMCDGPKPDTLRGGTLGAAGD